MPAAKVGCRAIGALKKRHKRRFSVARFPYYLVGQQELAENAIEICFFGGRLCLIETQRCGVRIRIKSWKIGSSAARPEASRRDLVTIGFARHIVGQCRYATWMEWSGTSRKARYCEIKAAPKEVHWTDLADIPGAKLIEHAIDCDNRLEEARYSVGV